MSRGSRPPAELVCPLSRVPGVSARVNRVSVIFSVLQAFILFILYCGIAT